MITAIELLAMVHMVRQEGRTAKTHRAEECSMDCTQRSHIDGTPDLINP